MAKDTKKGGKKTQPKIGKVEKLDKPEKAETPTKPAFLPKKLHTEPGGAKLKVASSGSTPKKGSDIARENRLKRAGFEIFNCPITNMPLDIGPRANGWLIPIGYDGKVMSWLARVILESGISPDMLDKTADLLRKK